LKPGFRAMIMPTPNVDQMSAADFHKAAFTRVARIRLFSDPPAGTKYFEMGFRSGLNFLEIRHQNTGWEARLVSGGTTTPVALFDRVPHYDAVVPGTARFRWNLKDDGAWAPCGQACCRIASIQ
jgi:hypothetical protein